MIKAYKIIETDDKGNIKTLFHGLNGTRIITPGVWLKAVEKLVRDGTGNKWYKSGWHVLLDEADAHDYLKRFTTRTEKLKVKPVMVKDIRPKKHSKCDVFLARHMKLMD